MKGVLSKHKSKEEGYPSVQQSTLQSKIEGLAAEIAEVEVLIQQAEATTLEAKEANVDELEKRLTEEQDKVSALIQKVTTSETLIRAGTPAKEALDEAAKIKKKFDGSVERLNQFKAFQETLKLPPAAIPEVAEFEKHFGIRHKLWQIRLTFGEQQRRWYGENFREQDAPAIVATVKERESELIKLKAQIGRDNKDEVHEAATREVKDVARYGNLIAALGNQAMQEKHWQKVWSLVETQPATLMNFPLTQLLQQGIENHFDKVEEISAFAAGEAGILKTVAEIQELWEGTSFTCRAYRDTKDRFFITEIEELLTQLEDHQMLI